MFCPGKITDMSNCPGAIDVAAQFLRVPFAHENAAFAPKRAAASVLRDLAWRAVVVTNFINCV